MDEFAFKEFLHLLKSSDVKIVVEYDTTFGLSDYYVSVLCYRHPFLINEKGMTPIIPLVFFSMRGNF
jgi:hypothetical protein